MAALRREPAAIAARARAANFERQVEALKEIVAEGQRQEAAIALRLASRHQKAGV